MWILKIAIFVYQIARMTDNLTTTPHKIKKSTHAERRADKRPSERYRFSRLRKKVPSGNTVIYKEENLWKTTAMIAI
jgi:hypothetical protein